METLLSPPSLTIWTNTGQQNQSNEPGNSKLFLAKKLPASPTEIKAHLKSCLKQTRIGGGILISLIIIDHVDGNLREALQKSFTRFPVQVLDNLEQGQCAALSPYYDPVNRTELTFLNNYPHVSRKGRHTEPNPILVSPAYNFDTYVVDFVPIATWVHKAADLNDEPQPGQDIIILCARSEHCMKTSADDVNLRRARPWKSLPDRLENYFGGPCNKWRTTRLRDCPSWIYVNLFYILTSWGEVWDVAKRDLALRDAQTHGTIRAPQTLELTRILHRNSSNTIALKEYSRLELAGMNKLQKGLNKTIKYKFRDKKIPVPGEYMQLLDRIEDHLEDLEHFQETSKVILRQFENLLSLAFNSSAASQGQAVKRLNTMAFAFIPLSLVASIFGITDLHVSPSWYPVCAIPLTLMIFIAAYFFGEGISQWAYKLFYRVKEVDAELGEERILFDGKNAEGTLVPMSSTSEMVPHWFKQRHPVYGAAVSYQQERKDTEAKDTSKPRSKLADRVRGAVRDPRELN